MAAAGSSQAATLPEGKTNASSTPSLPCFKAFIGQLKHSTEIRKGVWHLQGRRFQQVWVFGVIVDYEVGANKVVTLDDGTGTLIVRLNKIKSVKIPKPGTCVGIMGGYRRKGHKEGVTATQMLTDPSLDAESRWFIDVVEAASIASIRPYG